MSKSSWRQITGLNDLTDNLLTEIISVMHMILVLISIFWYIIIVCFSYIGWFEIMRKFSKKKRLSAIELDNQIEPISIIRPCKGVDTEMLICLESCILQNYPRDKVEVLFCVEQATDPCIPIIKQLLLKYPDHDLKLLRNDPNNPDLFGPNPKINNLSKAYRYAKHDIIWVLDSNVWCSPGTLIRSVESLKKSLDNGTKTKKPVILTHHIPLGISLNKNSTSDRLEEMFLFSSHATFYVAFNKISIAPCVNGKSNLYRRSELDEAVKLIGQAKIKTDLFKNPEVQRSARTNSQKSLNLIEHHHANFYEIVVRNGQFKEKLITLSEQRHHHGIEFFRTYIGEDNMIGTALWDMLKGRTGMTGDVVVQPLKFGIVNDSFCNYIDRRVRWQRVRKYMVLLATLLEPATESVLLGLIGSFGFSVVLKIPPGILFFIHIILWCIRDRLQYFALLKNPANDDCIDQTQLPDFLKINNERPFCNWLMIWVLREILAFPIWVKAMCGSVIYWRNKPFKIKSDLTAEAV